MKLSPRIMRLLNLEQGQRQMQARLLGTSQRTVIRLHERKGLLDSDKSDRVTRLASIYHDALPLFGDQKHTSNWLNTENASLGCKNPIDLLDTDIDTQQVEEALDRYRYGVIL